MGRADPASRLINQNSDVKEQRKTLPLRTNRPAQRRTLPQRVKKQQSNLTNIKSPPIKSPFLTCFGMSAHSISFPAAFS
jgi:hypothetical protein